MSTTQIPPEADAGLAKMWRDVWQKVRAICQEEIHKVFGANYIGGKLDAGAIGGTVPTTALPAATTTTAGIVVVDHNASAVLTEADLGVALGVAELDAGGNVPLAELGNIPLGSASTFGIVKADGSTITASGGVLSAAGGSGSGTVTNVTGTAPIAVATGTTTPVVSISTFGASGASHAAGAVPDPGSSAGSTKFLREDASWAVPAGGGSLSTSTAHLAAPVAMTTGGTFYDGPTITPAAGTYLLIAKGTLLAPFSTPTIVEIKLHDGTTIFDSAGGFLTGAQQVTFPLYGVVTTDGTKTYKLSATANDNGATFSSKITTSTRADLGNLASTIIVLKIG